MKIQWKKLILCIIIPVAVGALSGYISGNSMEAYKQLEQPPFSPPGAVFGIVWPILYVLMGIASYLICVSDTFDTAKKSAITVYAVQLAFNFLWSIWFFNLNLYYFAFIWLFLLVVLVIILMIKTKEISKPAFYMLVPYLLWLLFAGYLNLGIAILN